MTLQDMINLYNKYNKADKMIYGFIYNHKVYYTNHSSGLCLSRQSSNKGGNITLRYRPTKNDKMQALNNATFLISEQDFIKLINNSKYNKGEIFEKLITESYNQKWYKDSVPFYQGGDLTVNNITYQIKFQGATYCTEKKLLELEGVK